MVTRRIYNSVGSGNTPKHASVYNGNHRICNAIDNIFQDFWLLLFCQESIKKL